VADLDEDRIARLKGCYPADEFYFDEESARRAVEGDPGSDSYLSFQLMAYRLRYWIPSSSWTIA
jgi:hypothetical protein